VIAEQKDRKFWSLFKLLFELLNLAVGNELENPFVSFGTNCSRFALTVTKGLLDRIVTCSIWMARSLVITSRKFTSL
jgi:hypothetical protein